MQTRHITLLEFTLYKPLFWIVIWLLLQLELGTCKANAWQILTNNKEICVYVLVLLVNLYNQGRNIHYYFEMPKVAYMFTYAYFLRNLLVLNSFRNGKAVSRFRGFAVSLGNNFRMINNVLCRFHSWNEIQVK